MCVCVCQQRSDLKKNAVEKKWHERKAWPSDRMDVTRLGWKRNGETARKERHVTKCILITEQQMSRMELLCCLNSRTLHFSGLTSHCIHLPASCQFRLARVKEKGKKKRRWEGGSHQSVSPLPLHVLPRGCHSVLSFPPVACTISDLHTHPHLHALLLQNWGELSLSFGCCTIELLWTWLEARICGTKLHGLDR